MHLTEREIELGRKRRHDSRSIRSAIRRELNDQWKTIEDIIECDGFINCSGYTRDVKFTENPFSKSKGTVFFPIKQY